MIKMLIFDFDGTVADTADDIISATHELFEKYEREPVSGELIRDHIGLGLNQLMADIFPEFKDDKKMAEQVGKDFISIYEQHYLKSPKIFPGLEDLLDQWQHSIAIVSNKLERFLKPTVDHLGLNRYAWTHQFGRDSLEQCKPHALPLITCCEAAGVSPEEALMIGDGLPDVGSALNAQMQCVAVDFGYSPTHRLVEAGAHHVIQSYDELPQVIAKL
jgi:phosphoglycolate phosphatase